MEGIKTKKRAASILIIKLLGKACSFVSVLSFQIKAHIRQDRYPGTPCTLQPIF